MTQLSYFHNGTVKGDALHSPYSASVFHTLMNRMYGGRGFVVNTDFTSDSDLQVSFSAGTTVSIAAGSAFIEGVFYNNSAATTVTLEANASGHPRLDYIIIRIDWNEETAELGYVKGAPAAVPALPTLQQDTGNIYEQPVALCYIPDSFTGFGNSLIYDERQFIRAYPNTRIGTIFYDKNIIPNSEWIAGADTGPAMWESSSTIADTSEGSQTRGNNLEVTMVSGNTFGVNQRISKTAVSFVLSFSIKVLSGYTDFTDGVASQRFYPEADWRTVYFYGASTDAEIEFASCAAGTQFLLGNFTLLPDLYESAVPRYVVPPVSPNIHHNEIILFTVPALLGEDNTVPIDPASSLVPTSVICRVQNDTLATRGQDDIIEADGEGTAYGYDVGVVGIMESYYNMSGSGLGGANIAYHQIGCMT